MDYKLTMEIRKATLNDIPEICDFNARMFPERKVNCKKYMDFWLSRNDGTLNCNLLLTNENGQIYGQILASPMSYYYQQKRIDTVWLFDLIIDESLRKSAWGIDLLLECMELHPQSCSTGSGPTALPIHLKLGNSYLGDIRKYVGMINPFCLLTSYRKSFIPIEKFPMCIQISQSVYHKIGIDQLPTYDNPFNEDLFEVCRDYEYLKWRYFSNLHQYAFYLREDCKNFLVLRSIDVKGFRVMELVDYRCKNTEADFEEIYQAVAKVTRKVCLPALVCGSSLRAMDSVLEHHHFKSIGRPRPVLGFVRCKTRKEDIQNRNFCFVTLADSDGETNWI